MITLNAQKIDYFRKLIIRWEKANNPDFPWRITQNRWHALVAEVMLQRTRAEQVLPVWETFRSKYYSPIDYLKANKPDIFTTLGLNWRENQFKKLSETLSSKEIPTTKKELMELSGVGEYIASAYLSLHLNIREPIIDSNVVRLYGRFFGFDTNNETRRKHWFIALANNLTPKRSYKYFNYGLIDFPRTICRFKPLCNICIIRTKCCYYLD